MNWIVASVIMLLASNIYYLILRVSQKQGIHAKYSLVANFTIPPLLYFILGQSEHLSFGLPWVLLFIIFCIALFLSYIGSYASYIAMQEAPNGGYSVIIQKSYGIYTSIAAIFLFGSTFSMWKFVAIVFILFNSAVVMGVFDKKTKDSSSNTWIWLSILSFFCFGTLRLAGKWMITSYEVPQLVYQTWLLLFVAVISWIDLLRNKNSIVMKWTGKNIGILVATGVSVSAFYYFLLTAEIAAPNIGYVGAINTASNALFTILAAKLLGDALSTKKFLAVIGVTIGIIVLLM
jgi:uncharacterized membrane protein